MTRTTNRPLTICSEALVRLRQRPGSLPLAALFPAPLWGGVFSGLLLSLAAVHAQAAPAPIDTDFSPGQVLLTLPDMPAPVAGNTDDPSLLADQVQQYLEQSRREGDPRFLGYAQDRLVAWPEDRMTNRLLILRATLQQSLHQFDQARQDLEQVLAGTAGRADRVQALLTLANLETVQGNYAQAGAHCDRLQALYPGLIAASCQAQVRGRSGSAEAAFSALASDLAISAEPASARAWAQGTLAELAAQLDRPDTRAHWQQALELAPDDLYIRAQYADWLLIQGDHQGALALTEGYDRVDSLAVLRAVAMQRLGHPEADSLVADLDQRFAEARWRGTLLHQRDYARFLLDLRSEADAAVAQASANWQSQREPMDTRLLMQAALAAGDGETLERVQAWLKQHQQRDARYPEATP